MKKLSLMKMANRRDRVFIIAEISANHGQNLNRAITMIKKAKECGVNAVKFQCYTPDTITIEVDNKYFRINHPKWGGQTLYQLYKKAYTPWKWFKPLKKVADDYSSMINAAVEEVNNLQEKIARIPDGKVDIEEIQPEENPMAGKLALSREAVSIVDKTIKEGAAAGTFQEALEIGYRGFGEIACTNAAKEGISAFQQRRPPDFKS